MNAAKMLTQTSLSDTRDISCIAVEVCAFSDASNKEETLVAAVC